jgi:hypothetical protein
MTAPRAIVEVGGRQPVRGVFLHASTLLNRMRII